MKKLYLIPLTLILFACGSESSTEGSSEDTVTVDTTSEAEATEEVVAGDNFTELTEYIPENKDGNWQIDDYVEIFTQGKVYKNGEAYSESEDWSSSFYEILDISGGYARITGGYEGWSEYVLWRMKDGTDLLGTMSAGCGPVCEYNYKFYKCQGPEMNEVSRATIFPMAQIDDHREVMHEKIKNNIDYLDYPDDWQYIYRLPQKGTSMQVDLMVGPEEVTVPLVLLSWDKERFDIEEKYTEIPEQY